MDWKWRIFYETYAQKGKLAPLVREISWSKNIVIMDGCKDKLEREFELGTRSVRRNPLIADLLHRIALIEKAGTGIRRMIEDARKHKCPEPKFTVNGFFSATFRPNLEIARKIPSQVTGEVTGPITEQVGEQVGTKLALSRHQVEILHNCLQEKSLLGIMSQVGRKDRTKFRTKFIKPLVESGLLEMTTPDKPRSSKQCKSGTLLNLSTFSFSDQSYAPARNPGGSRAGA